MMFCVMHKLPSGWWSSFQSTDHQTCVEVAAAGEFITGWPHKVVTIPGGP